MNNNSFFDLTGKTALVTGATRGLGRAVAETLARAGARVAICSRNEDDARRVAEEVAGITGRTTFGMATDVAKTEDNRAFVREASAQLGEPDILVANAGTNVRKPAKELTDEDWRLVIDTNLTSAFVICREVLPGMTDRGWGRIVLLGSMLSHISLPGRAAYCSSKAGLLGLARTLALESAARGVCVNALCPGPFMTPMNEPLKETGAAQALAEKIPVGRWGNPDEIRGIALYLCSPACSYMTGSAVTIDGGWTAQ